MASFYDSYGFRVVFSGAFHLSVPTIIRAMHCVCFIMKPFKFLMVHMIFWVIKITCRIADTRNHVIMLLGHLRAGRMRYIRSNFWLEMHESRVEAMNWIAMMHWLVVYSSLPPVQLSAIAVMCHLNSSKTYTSLTSELLLPASLSCW